MSDKEKLETFEKPKHPEDKSLNRVGGDAARRPAQELETDDEIKTKPEGKTAMPEQPAKKPAKKAAPKK